MYLGRSRLWIASMFSRKSASASALSAAVDAGGTGVATVAVAHAVSPSESRKSVVRVMAPMIEVPQNTTRASVRLRGHLERAGLGERTAHAYLVAPDSAGAAQTIAPDLLRVRGPVRHQVSGGLE